MRLMLICAIAFLMTLVPVTPARCCTIPVFRYALDRWPAENYSVAVPDNLSAAMIEKFDLLKAQSANLDFQSTTEGTLSLFAPWSDNSIWSGESDASGFDFLVDSPGRRDLVRRILAGDSIVWVYVSDGTDDDARRIEQLEKRIAHVESIAGLPDMDPLDPTSQLGPGPPLKLQFSLMIVDRKDVLEKWFVRLLAGRRTELLEESTSFVAPVYGRGRVLDAIASEQLKEVMVDDVTSYLIAPCSCNVKSQNPGWDLLLAIDWGAELQKVASGVHRTDATQRREPSHRAESMELSNTEETLASERPDEVDQVVYGPNVSSVDDPQSKRGAFVIVSAILLGGFVFYIILLVRRV